MEINKQEINKEQLKVKIQKLGAKIEKFKEWNTRYFEPEAERMVTTQNTWLTIIDKYGRKRFYKGGEIFDGGAYATRVKITNFTNFETEKIEAQDELDRLAIQYTTPVFNVVEMM